MIQRIPKPIRIAITVLLSLVIIFGIAFLIFSHTPTYFRLRYPSIDDRMSEYPSNDDDLNSSDSGCTVTQSNYEYIYTIDLTREGYQLLDYNDALESYTFYVDYSVYTGKKQGSTWFEDLNRKYQNYMVKLTVELLDEDDIVMPGSNAPNHIIYTNARINPDIIDTAS